MPADAIRPKAEVLQRPQSGTPFAFGVSLRPSGTLQHFQTASRSILTSLPLSPIEGLTTIELTPSRAELLQLFFEDNPDYFLATSGHPPGPDEATEEISSQMPSNWGFTKKWVVGYLDADGRLAAMANLITDLLAQSVFHIGTFIVATNRHGSGDAQLLYSGLERWSRDNGAAWMRLGVVVGNERAGAVLDVPRLRSTSTPRWDRDGTANGRRTDDGETTFWRAIGDLSEACCA